MALRAASRGLGSALTTGLLAIAGCAALVVALVLASTDDDAPPSADTGAATALTAPSGPGAGRTGPREPPPRAADNRDRTHGPALDASDPVRLRIPGIDVVSPLIPLGLDAEGAMEVPPDGSTAGWYTGAPPPGALGPAVVAAHVTWDRRPALFHRLAELRPGDVVEVARADRTTAVFRVQRSMRFAKAHFPTRAVYGPVDRAALRLITCGGTFDESTGRYLDNVVVFATMVGSRPARS